MERCPPSLPRSLTINLLHSVQHAAHATDMLTTNECFFEEFYCHHTNLFLNREKNEMYDYKT